MIGIAGRCQAVDIGVEGVGLRIVGDEHASQHADLRRGNRNAVCLAIKCVVHIFNHCFKLRCAKKLGWNRLRYLAQYGRAFLEYGFAIHGETITNTSWYATQMIKKTPVP